MKSLRLRLVVFTLLAVSLVWLATALTVWREAHHELHELFASLPPAVRIELEHERREVVKEIAEHLAKPVLIALPLLAVFLMLAVTLALRPLGRLAGEVSARAPDRLEALAVEGAPPEVAPLIERLNQLFADIGRALENERRFTADAAHELRTPLAALKAQAQVALAAVDETERRHALTQILVGCDRATHLVAQLLTLARLDSGTPHPMQEVALRQVAADVLAASAGDAIAQHCDLDLRDGDATVAGDALLLQVLLRNLVDNAIRHSGGSRIEVAIVPQADRVVLRVSDNGRGIAGSERERMPQRFHRAAGADSWGAGLGLSIVKRIAELHGATLAIAAPASGPGLVLSVDLPRASPAPAGRAAA
jgi:signal transduction histidine kinase